jgi:hypothetical protein
MAFAAAQRERADALRYQAAQNFLYFADRIADFAAKNGLPVKRDAGVRKISGLYGSSLRFDTQWSKTR